MEKQGTMLEQEQSNEFISTLKERFEKHMDRHKELNWDLIKEKLDSQPSKVWSLFQMEQTGGEPDVLFYDEDTKEYLFYDCAPETPSGRRSLCYDGAALASRKENKPRHSAMGMAEDMGIEMLSEEEYRRMQQVVACDLKSSSWIATPDKIRKAGGSLFCDRRYDTVFVYHNGAESYYAGRGFRGRLKV
jgi:predicted PolB exonuclease-like 3'-5' exonuclease